MDLVVMVVRVEVTMDSEAWTGVEVVKEMVG
jgi:hypothetical protein